VRSARASGSDTVGTEHLLTGLLADDTNLAMVVLTSMEIEPAAIGQALAAAGVTAAAAEAAATSAAPLTLTPALTLAPGPALVPAPAGEPCASPGRRPTRWN
jgi:hypothetical protein